MFTSSQMFIWMRRFRFVHEISTFYLIFLAKNGRHQSLSVHTQQSKVRLDLCSIGPMVKIITHKFTGMRQTTFVQKNIVVWPNHHHKIFHHFISSLINFYLAKFLFNPKISSVITTKIIV